MKSKAYVSYSQRSNLSDSDVLDIRQSAANGNSVRQIANSFNTPKSTVHDIISMKTWAHVPSPASLRDMKSYSIYPDGRVWSAKSNKFLTPKYTKNGVTVDLVSKGNRKTVNVATLVARAFLNKKNVRKIDFIDGDSENVHFTNISA